MESTGGKENRQKKNSEDIREELKVQPLRDKVEEKTLKWARHLIKIGRDT